MSLVKEGHLLEFVGREETCMCRNVLVFYEFVLVSG